VAPVYRQRPEGQSGYALDRVSFHLFDTFDEAVAALQNDDINGLAARERMERDPLLDATRPIPSSIHTAIQPELGALIFNWAGEETSYFRDQRVRIALQGGIDRSAVVERRLPNMAIRADSPIMIGSWAYKPDLPWSVYDPAAALALLDTARQRAEQNAEDSEATEESEAAGRDIFEFVILTPDDDNLFELAQEIANQWGALGLQVAVSREDVDTYQERLRDGNFAVALIELSLGDSADPDVYEFWHQGQYPDGKNYGGVNDRRISETLERARQEVSGINRIELYHQFQTEFAERAIAIPLYYPLFSYAVADAVEGVQLGFIGSPEDRFRNIGAWSIRGT
jgi:ABC-type transport system substrate-binding protein